MRKLLVDELKRIGAKGNWDHITKHVGWFSFSCLSLKQTEMMEKKHHVYMHKNGRIAITHLTVNNIPYVASAIKDVMLH